MRGGHFEKTCFSVMCSKNTCFQQHALLVDSLGDFFLIFVGCHVFRPPKNAAQTEKTEPMLERGPFFELRPLLLPNSPKDPFRSQKWAPKDAFRVLEEAPRAKAFAGHLVFACALTPGETKCSTPGETLCKASGETSCFARRN